MTEADRTTQQMYNTLMKSCFGPALRAAGLRGSSGRFDLPSDTHWVQLGFQKSTYSDSFRLSFTINLSVVDRDTWTQFAAEGPGYGPKPSPNTYYGETVEHVRIGKLMPSGEDFWWQLQQSEDPLLIREQVVAVLRELAVPWLLARSSR